jgi:ADP-dependent NAD(P)H-hydrate dehydratase / NAD(P)H-hydrate epimerase
MSGLEAVCPPVLSCANARDLEADLFRADETKEWAAMRLAGLGIARHVLRDFDEIGGFPPDGRVLVLVGKGHNGGDALLAVHALLERFSHAAVDVVFAFGERTLRPLAARAWRDLAQAHGGRGNLRGFTFGTRDPGMAPSYDLCLDGIFGFQFRSPADARIVELIASVNARPIRFRAAVDLPSAGLFRADFTYATGSVKEPLLRSETAGRVRYLDLGFFPAGTGPDATDRVLTAGVLDRLRALRPATSDKRSYGHVFLLGGSRGFPGAILMATMAAIRSGAGLVTAFVPESLSSAFAARLPEAIWVPWPETPAGGLALEGEHLLRERIERADAVVVGPGIGREPETLALAASVVEASAVPLVIDADALQRDVVLAGGAARVLTPHGGEFKRIAGDEDLRTFAAHSPSTVVLKGPVTQVSNGRTVWHSFFGGPVLARGGSGDVLSGMIGTQLAQTPKDPLAATARGVVWHGLAADCLARAQGSVAVQTTQLLHHLAAALHSEWSQEK